MVLVFLADGFEEVEALAPVDLLRRAGLQVITVGVGGKWITGSHGIRVEADRTDGEIPAEGIDAVVLPGGKAGTSRLDESPAVRETLLRCAADGAWIAAICAAPSVLAHCGLLQGKRATAYPDFQGEVAQGGGILSDEFVVQDGKTVTARGMGVSTQFGLKLAECLVSRETAEQIRASIQWEACQ